ncbi:MAG TPA: hypothetical protein VFN97_24955 [Actinospica sp.]|nr:hypothetical protein [Actinospica sp.]
MSTLTSVRRHRRGDAARGEQAVVRCCAHHLFTTTWSADSAFTVGRYGPMRFQRCPVAHHWSLVTRAASEELTEEQRQAAAAFRDARIG